MITKEQFLKYEKVRVGGKTNMFDTRMVEILSGLEQEVIYKIMKQYTKLATKYLN